MKLAFGCDPNATEFKAVLLDYVKSKGHECTDFGSDDPIYANVAIQVAEEVAAGHFDRGILICGTGIGVCIAANKVKGALCGAGQQCIPGPACSFEQQCQHYYHGRPGYRDRSGQDDGG